MPENPKNSDEAEWTVHPKTTNKSFFGASIKYGEDYKSRMKNSETKWVIFSNTIYSYTGKTELSKRADGANTNFIKSNDLME
jgi:hypothetical protein